METPKRKKVELTIDQKQQICLFYKECKEKGKKITHDEITKYFSKKFNKILSRATITLLLKQSENLLACETKDRIRNRGAKHPELEEALFLWFSELRRRQVQITDEILIRKGI